MALWTPAEITGDLWIDPDDASTITLNGSTVARINDKFGGANYAAQATASYQPLLTEYGLNGHDVLTFSTDKLTLSTALDFRSKLVCLVVRQTTAALAQMWSHSTINNQFRYDATATGFYVAGGTPIWANSVVAAGCVTFGAWSVVVFDGNTSAGVLYVNGVAVDSGGSQSVATSFNQLGARSTISEPLIGDIAMALIVANTADRQVIEGYLHWHFGLESLLPVGHPYKLAAPGITRYAVNAALVGEYSDVPVVSAAFVGQYSIVMEQALICRYGDAPVVLSGLVGRYGDTARVQSALVGRYGDTVPVLAALVGRYALMHQVMAAMVGQYAICGSEVISALTGRYDLRQRDEIMAALEGYYSLLPDAAINQIVCPVLIGGVAVKWSSVSWTLSGDNYLIEATITLRDGAEYNAINKQDTCTITWMGTTYDLFVSAKLRSRSISGEPGAAEYGADYVVIARSLTNGLDAPHALPVSMEWPSPTMASDIAADLIGELEDIITLDWQMEDWLQPGGTFFVTDQTPMEGIRSLAAISGGIVQSGPDSSLIVRAADQVPPSKWATIAPAWVIDNAQLFADSESEQVTSRYNVVTVTNQSESAQSVRFELEDISDYRKRVKGYRTPWADFGLATSGGSWVTIEDEGIVEQTITETVEFVDGAATASKPVYSAISASWQQASLGAITASEDGGLVAAVVACSMAIITYTTKYHAWIGSSDRDETVQFYQVEL